jgi:hypothetical protein
MHIQRGMPLPTAPTAYGLDGSDNAEVHSTGEVWTTCCGKRTRAAARQPRLTFDQAQDRMLRYLVAAYKAHAHDAHLHRGAMTRCSPSRWLKDQQRLRPVLARLRASWHGHGRTAPDRDSSDNRPAVESFVVGNSLAITDVTIDDSTMSCDTTGVLDTDEVGKVSWW